jgi:hypothetical protein
MSQSLEPVFERFSRNILKLFAKNAKRHNGTELVINTFKNSDLKSRKIFALMRKHHE